MASYARQDDTNVKRESQRQPDLQQQGAGQQDSLRKDAAERYSATGQQRDKASPGVASGHDPNTPPGHTPDHNPPDEIPQKDDRPERYPVEDATRDTRAHHRP